MRTHPYDATVEDIRDGSCAFKDFLTNSHVDWEGPHTPVNADEFIEAIDIKEVIQEIVDLDEWDSGKGIILVFHNDELADKDINISNKYYKIDVNKSFLEIST